MRTGAQGWRSSRGLGAGAAAGLGTGVGSGVGADVGLQPQPHRGGAQRGVAAVPEAVRSSFPRIEDRFPWPWQGVDFSPGFVCFLLYFFVITSYVVNLGQVAMASAIAIIKTRLAPWRCARFDHAKDDAAADKKNSKRNGPS